MSQIPILVEFIARNIVGIPSCALFFLTSVIIALVIDVIKKLFFKTKIVPHQKAVFITGCDSGFGNALAKRLDSKGFHVFATCLLPTGTGAKELKDTCSERLHVLHMDVTKDESVEKAFHYVKENLGSNDFWAIVNNAGIIKGFSVELSSIDDFKDCMDVNLLGCVRVTKAFLPLLKKTKGRIVNVTSAAGEISFPFFTPYTASKYAAVGFNDCLRLEVDTWGIKVISIEPELFQTGLTSPDTIDKNMDATLKDLGSSFKEVGYDYEESMKSATKIFLSFACPKISFVVDDMESAVSLAHPYHTYKPRRSLFARFICFCYEITPRSCQIMLVKLGLRVLFSESKGIRNFVEKILCIHSKKCI